MGGKRTRLPPPEAGSASTTSSDPLDRVEAHLTRALELVEAAIGRGEATPATIRESAAAARALCTLSAERRARAKAERAGLEEITVANVVEWLRSASGRDRSAVASALSANRPKSGLA